jgi:hypothetical protein
MRVILFPVHRLPPESVPDPKPKCGRLDIKAGLWFDFLAARIETARLIAATSRQ